MIDRAKVCGGGGILILCAFLTGCEPPDVTISEPVIRPVRTQQIFASGGRRVRIFSGVAKPGMESKISFKVGGTVSSVLVEVGDRVAAGRLIARIDPVDYELRVQESEAAVRQAQAQLLNARANFDRISGLYENDNATQADYDTARTAVDSAKATVEAYQKRLEQARQQVTYTRLGAPLGGVIAEVHVETNENVSSGQPIVTLNSGALPEVEVAVPEQLITQIKRGSEVEVRFDAIPGERFPAEVSEVGVVSSQFATTFEVSVRLRRPEPRVRPGMAAEVGFPFGQEDQTEQFFVPPHTVSEDRQGRFVYIVIPESEELGVVRRRPVTVGDLSAQGLEIVEGLTDGDSLVTAGIDRIEDGMRVKLLPSGGE